MKQIPNIFTLLNLVFGCLAIIFIFKYNMPDAQEASNLSGMGLILGCACIALAAVVDFLDGFVARLFHATSAMGEQLDSLADAVSFGVAPGMIMYQLLPIAFSKAYALTAVPQTYLWPALLLPCAAVWRLAKFNIDKEQRYYFKGVPVPASGLVIASLPLIAGYPKAGSLLLHPITLYTIIIVLSALMVSHIPIISFKFKSKKPSDNIDKIIIVLVAFVSAIFFQWIAVPLVFIAYVIVSLIVKPNKI